MPNDSYAKRQLYQTTVMPNGSDAKRGTFFWNYVQTEKV